MVKNIPQTARQTHRLYFRATLLRPEINIAQSWLSNEQKVRKRTNNGVLSGGQFNLSKQVYIKLQSGRKMAGKKMPDNHVRRELG
ncbi:hypothetical protein [Pantoea dispersa]|uniref:hypothetical protein n=1 Tax=Pantoea dispersa TaxID=59814 RepID=UPI000417A868|nr:hypothetical protein [Pantoea dispersa]